MFLKGSKSSRDAKGWGLTAGLAMAGAEENVLIPNGSSFNPELVLKLSLNGLLLFSGTGETLLNSRGGKAGGGTRAVGAATKMRLDDIFKFSRRYGIYYTFPFF